MIWVQTGKAGDLLSILPILHHEFKTTGKKPRLIVAKEYLPVLARSDYVEPIVWPHDWQDLRGAVMFAKQRYDHVITPQIFGKDFPIAKLTPSFQLDQWLRAGHLDKWDTLPLALDRPKYAKSLVAQHYKPGEKVILYADHSQSSPFPQKDELYRLLVDHFGTTHTIKRLSEIRCDNPLDLLALFDAADCLVTVETMMLHLSAASKVPVVALIGDSPTRWKGSAWSKRFLAHIRYVDFTPRKTEIVEAVRRAVDKVQAPRVELLKTSNEFAYNPSIIRHGDKLWTSWRYHPDKTWRTELALTDYEQTWKIEVPKFNDHSLEDMRLFEHAGDLYGSLTIARDGEGMSRGVCGYGRLHIEGDKCTLVNLTIPKYGKNDFQGIEKNLVFWSMSNRIFCTYQTSPEHIVLELNNGAVVKEHRSPTPACEYGSVRGGTQVFPYQDRLLRFAHALQRNERSDQWWTYHLVALLIDPQPPFSIVAISKRPILSGTEQYFHCRRYKPRVIIPYGAMADGDSWTVSVGINDAACGTVKLNPQDLNL